MALLQFNQAELVQLDMEGMSQVRAGGFWGGFNPQDVFRGGFTQRDMFWGGFVQQDVFWGRFVQ